MNLPGGTAAYEFDLPPELIAQDPLPRRGDSRMLLVEPGVGVRGEVVFRELPRLLRAGDLLVLNESRVMPARLLTERTDTGGKVEILLVRPVPEQDAWLALARPGRRLRPGVGLEVVTGAAEEDGAPRPRLEVVARLAEGQVLVTSPEGLYEVAERWGIMPLPPYIRRNPRHPDRQRDLTDRERYQTVFAAGAAGSVAAPTAGLHFSAETLRQLEKAGVGLARVSLHVGPGTFRPPSPEQVARGRLHREFFHLPITASAAVDRARQAGGRIIAVGTTSLRVLETVARLGLDAPGPAHRRFGPTDGDADPVFTGEAFRRGGCWDVRGDTRLFLKPPTPVVAVDGLLTNFHLPGSSLLMLVAAVAGENIWPMAYDHAVRNRMRFYSYGDCMLILPGLSGPAESR